MNPGGSFASTTKGISEMLSDDRVRLFLNKSDFINQAYTQETTSDSDVVWGESTPNPYLAHRPEQWSSGDFEEDRPIIWPDYEPPPEGSPPVEESWPVGEATQYALTAEPQTYARTEPITQ